MNVQSLSFSRGAHRWATHISLVLAVLFIAISAVWGEATFPLQHGGGNSPDWVGPTLPEIPDLPDPPALPGLPTLPPTPADQDTPGDYSQDDSSNSGYGYCDPFEGLYGRNVLVHLEGDQVISGYLIQVCRGYIVLEQLHIQRTFIVNSAKVLYYESTAIQ